MGTKRVLYTQTQWGATVVGRNGRRLNSGYSPNKVVAAFTNDIEHV